MRLVHKCLSFVGVKCGGDIMTAQTVVGKAEV